MAKTQELKTAQVAEMLGMNQLKLRLWAQSGKCPFAVAFIPEGSSQYEYVYSEGGVKKWMEGGNA